MKMALDCLHQWTIDNLNKIDFMVKLEPITRLFKCINLLCILHTVIERKCHLDEDEFFLTNQEPRKMAQNLNYETLN